MTPNRDRMVHASRPDADLVRYDRAGKWFVEYDDGKREPIPFKFAVEWAVALQGRVGTVHYGLPGGSRFDSAVRRAVTALEQGK